MGKAAGILLAALLLVVSAGAAMRHAELVRAEPAVGGRAEPGITRLRLVFSEPLEPQLARVAIVRADGTVETLQATGDPRDVNAIVATTVPLAAGTYRVRWQIVSADGHPVDGSYVFALGGEVDSAVARGTERLTVAAETAATDAATVRGASVIARLLALVALEAAGGLLFFLLLSGATDARAQGVRTLASRLTLATPVLFGAQLALMTVEATPAGASMSQAFGPLLAGALGTAALWRIGLSALVVWAAWLARRDGLTLLAIIATIVSTAFAGHAMAASPAASVTLKALHLLATAAWLGGIVWATVHAGAPRDVLVRELTRVSSVALPAVVVLAVTGLAQAWLIVPFAFATLGSAYGGLLIAKAAGLAVLVGYGAWHRQRVLPRLAQTASPIDAARTLRQELAVLLLVLVIAAILAATALPPGSATLPNPTGAP